MNLNILQEKHNKHKHYVPHSTITTRTRCTLIDTSTISFLVPRLPTGKGTRWPISATTSAEGEHQEKDIDQEQASLSQLSPSFSTSRQCSHQRLTSCCHLTSSQLAKVYISCMVHPNLGATSSTSRNLHIRLSTSWSTSRQGQHQTSVTSVEFLEADLNLHHLQHRSTHHITGITSVTSWTS